MRAARRRFAADVCKAHMADLETVLRTKEGRAIVGKQARPCWFDVAAFTAPCHTYDVIGCSATPTLTTLCSACTGKGAETRLVPSKHHQKPSRQSAEIVRGFEQEPTNGRRFLAAV